MKKHVKKPWLWIVVAVIALALIAGISAVSATPEATAADPPRTLSVILYDWISDFDEYWGTMESEFEAAYPDIDLQRIDLPGYYENLDTTEADVYEVDESGLRMLKGQDRLQPLDLTEVPDPDDFFQICKDVAFIDGQWWGIPHWTCSKFMFYNKNDTKLAKVKTFSQLRKVIGGKNHKPGKGLLIDMYGFGGVDIYIDAVMDLYPNRSNMYRKFVSEGRINKKALEICRQTVEMMDPGNGRNRENDKIFDDLMTKFVYGNGRAFVYYSEAVGYFQQIQKWADGYGDTTIDLNDLAVRAFPQNETGKICQPGYVDTFCLDKKLTGQKRADAITYIQWVTSRDAVMKQVLPAPGNCRYLSLARKSIYNDPELNAAAPLYKQFLRVMQKARFYPNVPPYPPALEKKVNALLPKN